MKHVLAIFLILLFADANSQATDSPNIILIFLDDMGNGDLGCTGALSYQTPTIDALANQGLRFTNFLTAQAVCSASRAGLLTGAYPNRIGITGALFPGSKIGIHAEETTLAEVLKTKGYATSCVGKWHLGDAAQFLPLQHGFDQYMGIPYSNDMWPVDYDGSPAKDAGRAQFPPLFIYEGNSPAIPVENLEDQATLTGRYTEAAVAFIRDHATQPFFLYLAHSMPHVPINASSRFKGKSAQGLYGDVMMEIDWSVQELMRTVRELGLEQNTLFIFTSDNGPWLHFGSHAGSTGGLREGKGTTYEGGQRVPCIMYWKGRIKPGVSGSLASTLDILPTICSLVGADLPPRPIDGVSLKPILDGDYGARPRTEFYYYYRRNNLEVVRMGDWKLVFEHPSRTYEQFGPGADGFPGLVNERASAPTGLYDLRRDPGERYDVRKNYPDVVKRLETLAAKARLDLGDDLTNSPGSNRREPGKVE